MKKWLKIILVIVTFAAVSAILYFILRACNITTISTLKSIIKRGGKYAIIIYTLILVFVLIAFCFVPFLNVAITVLGVVLFGSKIAFIANIIAVFCSTSILFFIGDKLGEKFAAKLVGQESLEETQSLIDHKSKFWLPILFFTPGVPDEAICLVAGMTKMKFWYLMLISLIYHSFEIGLCCFVGSGLINWATLELFDWIILVNIILIDVYLLIKFEKYLDKKKKIK